MSSHVPGFLRRIVVARAHGLCEYCLVHEADAFFTHQIEHIVSEKHGGLTVEADLAYSCVLCNRFKGSGIASISHRTRQLCRFFNPRTDRWGDHFRLDGVRIEPISDIGEVTVWIFELNRLHRRLEREALQRTGRYPLPAALGRTTTE